MTGIGFAAGLLLSAVFYAVPLTWVKWCVIACSAYASWRYYAQYRSYRLFHLDPAEVRRSSNLHYVEFEAYTPDTSVAAANSGAADTDDESSSSITSGNGDSAESTVHQKHQRAHHRSRIKAWAMALLLVLLRGLRWRAASRAARTEIRWNVLELRMWDPAAVHKQFLLACNPLTLYALVFGRPLDALLWSAVLYAVHAKFGGLLVDKELLFEQVLNEYNLKYVFPRTSVDELPPDTQAPEAAVPEPANLKPQRQKPTSRRTVRRTKPSI